MASQYALLGFVLLCIVLDQGTLFLSEPDTCFYPTLLPFELIYDCRCIVLI